MSEYPSSEQLVAIITLKPTPDFFDEMISLIREAYNEDYGAIRLEGNVLRLVTGGWSGNEEVISALQDNEFFWQRYWTKTERGGAYEFTR